MDLDEVHSAFEDWLISTPEQVDPDKAELLQVLGVGEWRR